MAPQETAGVQYSAEETGKRIREQRIRLGYSQDQLAAKMNFSNKSSISQVENGWKQFNWEQLLLLANILHTTTDYILTGKQNNRITLQITFDNAEAAARIFSVASTGSAVERICNER